MLPGQASCPLPVAKSTILPSRTTSRIESSTSGKDCSWSQPHEQLRMSTPASAASSIASCGCGVCWKPSTVARRHREYIERNRRAVTVRVIGRIGCGSGRRRHVGELVRGVIGVLEKAGIDDADLDVLPARARRHFQKLTNFLIRDAMP